MTIYHFSLTNKELDGTNERKMLNKDLIKHIKKEYPKTIETEEYITIII